MINLQGGDTVRIRLRFEGPLSVPIAYHSTLQHTLYSLFPVEIVRAWRESHGFRPFAFSRLLGRTRVGPLHQLAFSGPIDWWISLRQMDDARSLLARIQTEPVLVIEGQRMAIAEMEMEPRFVWTREIMGVTTLSPIVADDNVNGRIVSYAPEDPRFERHIAHNAQAKARQFLGRSVDPLTIRPLETSRVRSWYGTTPVVGYRGRFVLQGDPDLLTLLYEVGIGRRNGLGFGYCDAFLPSAEQVTAYHA